MKLCIVTGGSGGHIFPALTFAHAIKDKHDVFFIGNDHKMESHIVPDAGFTFFSIHNDGIQGSILFKIKAVISQFGAIRAAKRILKEQQPDAVFAFGGYVCVPVTLAAQQLGIPIIIHEQNAFPGKANRLMASKAALVITSYAEAFRDLEHVKHLGNPQASVMETLVPDPTVVTAIGLDPTQPLVLGVMGSQGSQSMNKVFMELLEHVSHDYQYCIVVGPTNFEAFEKEMPKLPDNVVVLPFVNQLGLLPYVDLMVCRAGASTIAEIESYGIASILIPSPHVANNHQHYNAVALLEDDACVLLEEAHLTGALLQQSIDALMKDTTQLEALRTHVSKRAKRDALNDIVEAVEDVMQGA